MTLVGLVDRIVPKRSIVLVRSQPDISDQAREMVRALERCSQLTVVWLVDDPATVMNQGFTCQIVAAQSFQALKLYWQASVVVHTHGVFGSKRGSRRKTFVNIWHGMPVKRIDSNSDVGNYQSDLTIATSPVHATHLADTWGLPLERVKITGLPRNDLMMRPPKPLPKALQDRIASRPLVLWLPTYRTSVSGHLRADGRDIGIITQLDGGDLDSVDASMAAIGCHAIIKAHPMAPSPPSSETGNLTVWSDRELQAAGLTLYELMAHADVIITDHSSVWIDFLLTGSPILFAMSDREDFKNSRGYFFDDLDALLPGPISTTMEDLHEALHEVLNKSDAFAEERAESLKMHHTHVDARSADRVVDLVCESLPG